ncbi:MAG: type II toxin-antitoxin system RelE/ParE family toxin [Dehalococcoidia bacterium]|nr:type II toxin-antitoxin system RelE/ParE family toxin [Dehalococcoidia bacterium]
MSSHDVRLILAPRAENDFADILQYTLETWGEHQVYVYRAVLDKALLTIQQSPQIGQPRPELSPTHRTFPAGQHVIVYRPAPDAVYVSRILHERMDRGRHL